MSSMAVVVPSAMVERMTFVDIDKPSNTADEADLAVVARPLEMSSAVPVANVDSSDWSSGLFECLDDVPICLYVAVMPCCAFGHIMAAHFPHLRSHDECCAFLCFSCCACCSCHHTARREQVRVKHHLPARPVADLAATWLCPCLSLCQLARQAKVANPDANLIRLTM